MRSIRMFSATCKMLPEPGTVSWKKRSAGFAFAFGFVAGFGFGEAVGLVFMSLVERCQLPRFDHARRDLHKFRNDHFMRHARDAVVFHLETHADG